MQLSDEQIENVKTWIRSGKSLAAVQNLLREEYNVAMTYMDVRFLVDDLGVVAEDVEEPVIDSSEAVVEEQAITEEAPTETPELVEPEAGVRVEVDPIKRPGALLSGTVVFSDGKSMGWQLDANGQLGLLPGDDAEYRPSPEDVQAFQAELTQVLQAQGF
jgi:hypothetical protein